MKNVKKVILPLILGAGVVSIFGSTFALYKNKENAGDKTITIGSVKTIGEADGKVNYSFGDTKSYIYDVTEKSYVELGDHKLNPDFNQIKLNMPLTFAYDSSLTAYKQPYAVGRLSVKISIDKALPADTKAYAYLQGYDKVGGENTYFYNNKRSDFFNTTFTADSSKNTEVTKFIDTAIPESGITLEIVIDFSTSITSSNFLNIAELTSAYTVTATWGGYKETYTNFDSNLIPKVYVAGSHSSWDDLAQYEMVPNVAHTNNKVEWMNQNLTGSALMKIHDATKSSWVTCTDAGNSGASQTGDGNNNVVLDVKSTYNLYYSRGEDNNNGYSFSIAKVQQ